MDEEDIITRVLNGEKELFNILVKRYYNMAYARALGLVLNREDAEEIVQDSFLTSYTCLDNLRNTSRFAAWLGGIVHRKSVYFLRKKIKKRENIEGITAEHATLQVKDAYKGRGPAQQEILNERAKIIEQELAGLDKKYREVIYMRYFRGSSYREIADFLGMTPSGVDSRLQRARAKLQERLRKRGITYEL